MTQNKCAILILSPLTIAALVTAWLLDFLGITFWSNVLLGVFGSGFLTVLVSSINYSTERKKALNAFWTFGHKAAKNLNRYPFDSSIYDKANAIILMSEFDFSQLGDAYAEIDFILNNEGLKKRIFNELYCPLADAGDAVSYAADNIIRLRRDIPNNPQVYEDYVKAVDDVLVENEEKEIHGDGRIVKVSCKSNKIFAPCYERFNGFYWKIMYPFKKQEEEDNAD